MKFYVVAALLCLGANASHPIEKVIDLLKGLKADSIKEGQAEEVAYNKFTYWCSTSIKDLKDAIAGEKEAISELEDLLSGKKKEKEVLEGQIDDLETQIGEMDAAALDAKNIRADEAKLYAQVLKDAKATIQAVDDALKAMTSAEGSTEAFAQVRKVVSLISLSSSTTETEVSTLQAFGQQRPKQLAEGDEGAHVDKYDFKSENVIELLKNLKQKFQDEKTQATKEETNSINAYDLAKSARDNAKTAANKSKDKKTGTLGKVKNTIATATGELKDQNSDKDADSKGLHDTETQCQTKKEEWNARSEVRANELVAMDTAMKILSKATGVRTEAPSNPVPPASPVDFLQIAQSGSNPKVAAVQVLREAAQTTHSKALERLAMEVSAHLTGPFDQVNNMVEKMIFRLMDEQKKEDEHKHWCDQELKKTNVMLDDKADKIKDLAAEIKSENAAVAKLTEEIKDADEMIADIIAHKKEATEIREVGKKENTLAIKDAETAQTALANAIAVLQQFYKDSGEIAKEPWEFIQAPVKLPKNPATWDSSYTGVSDPKAQPGGIVSVLEASASDFAQMEADTKAQEAADQKEYDQSMSDNDIEMARRKQESGMKAGEKKRRTENIATLQGQKKDTSAEHEKTDQYLADLQKACVNGDSSYEDRKAARSKEVDALKKAQVILEDAFKAKSFLQIRRA
jgi:hypothetical protein